MKFKRAIRRLVLCHLLRHRRSLLWGFKYDWRCGRCDRSFKGTG